MNLWGFIYNGVSSAPVTKDLEPGLSCTGAGTLSFIHDPASKCAPEIAKRCYLVHVCTILITGPAFYLMLLMLPASDPSLHLSSWVATIWRSASSSLVRRSNWSSYGDKGRWGCDQGIALTRMWLTGSAQQSDWVGLLKVFFEIQMRLQREFLRCQKTRLCTENELF